MRALWDMIKYVWYNMKKIFLKRFHIPKGETKWYGRNNNEQYNWSAKEDKTKEYIDKLSGTRMFKCVNVKKYYKQNYKSLICMTHVSMREEIFWICNELLMLEGLKFENIKIETI